jgi:hypothetical protein
VGGTFLFLVVLYSVDLEEAVHEDVNWIDLKSGLSGL